MQASRLGLLLLIECVRAFSMKSFRSLVACIFVLLTSCSSDSNYPYSSPATYFSTMTELVVEVAYEPAAAPFTGAFRSTNYWNILEDNLEALFLNREKAVTVTVPKALTDMQAIPAQGKTTWTLADAEALANRYKTQTATATKGAFIVVFVSGYMDDGNGGSDTSVIGLNITSSPIIVLFKDVISSSGINPSGLVPKFVEQSTLVHEMGHALGLVNNGVPMKTAHQDTSHDAHCNNQDCVMYYLNEGVADLAAFATQLNTTSNLVLFKSECLADTQGYKP